MTTTKEKLEFVYAMARHTRATVRQCEALMRYAATLHRLAETACNRELTEREIRKEENVMAKAIAITAELELDLPLFSHDPRGAVLKIRVSDGFTNDFGGEGICVPS